MQSWCKTWLLNGSNRIHAKQKLRRKLKGECKSSWSRIGSLKSFILTIPWNLAKLVKIYHCTSTPHRSETDGIAERAVRRVKEGTSAVLLQSGLDGKWRADSLEWYLSAKHSRSLFDGKTLYERRFGEPVKGPIIPFDSLVEYHPITAKDQSRIHQFGKKVSSVLFLGYVLYAGRIWKGDILVVDLEELEKVDASEIYAKKTQCERGDNVQEWFKIHIPCRRWKSKIFWRRSGPKNINFDTGSPNSRTRSSRFSGRIRRVSTTSRLISGCRWSDKRLLVHVGKLQKPPSRWSPSQTLLVERGIISHSTKIHWRLQNYTYEFCCYARKPHRRLLEHRWVSRLVRSLDRFHTVHFIERTASRRICMIRVEIAKDLQLLLVPQTHHPGLIICGQKSGVCQGTLSWKKSIIGLAKNRSSISFFECFSYHFSIFSLIFLSFLFFSISVLSISCFLISFFIFVILSRSRFSFFVVFFLSKSFFWLTSHRGSRQLQGAR